jgi:glycosyltransferase involved in cell wall biosynthesis
MDTSFKNNGPAKEKSPDFSGTPPLSVSVVICTLNRENPLIHVLQLLKSQTIKPMEILVIDQSSDHLPSTRTYLQENKDHLRYFSLSQPSTTAARNLAIKEVRGDLILFLDDDVLFYPSLIQAHLDNYQDPNIGAVTGKVLYDGSRENDWPWAARITSSGKYLRNFTTNQKCSVPTLYGCNMSILKRVIEQVGRFDLNYWGNFLWEEVDYAMQIRKQGYQILYAPEAAVFHVMASKGGSRNPSPLKYLESTIFNDWYFFFKYLNTKYWPFLFFRQKRVWLQYLQKNRGNLFPLFNQICRAYKKSLSSHLKNHKNLF